MFSSREGMESGVNIRKANSLNFHTFINQWYLNGGPTRLNLHEY